MGLFVNFGLRNGWGFITDGNARIGSERMLSGVSDLGLLGPLLDFFFSESESDGESLAEGRWWVNDALRYVKARNIAMNAMVTCFVMLAREIMM